MLSQLTAFFAPPTFADEDKTRDASLLNVALLAIISASLLFTLFQFLATVFSGGDFDFATPLITLSISAALFGLWLLMRRGNIKLVSYLLATLLLIAITASLYIFNGIRDNVVSGYILVIMVTSLLLRKQTPILIFTNASIVASFIIYLLEVEGLIDYAVESVQFDFWIVLAVMFTLSGWLMRYAMRNLDEALARARDSEKVARQANEQLQALNLDLEDRVADRTKALATTIEVGRQISTILERDKLVKEVVEQVQTAFDYYHVHIYLVDEEEERLRMVGGTGAPGQQMLAQGHTLEMGQGLVGRAARTNSVVLVSDVTRSEEWLPNPLLPHTKAEIALPIAIGDRLLGVLDVQQNEIDGVQQEDEDVLISISNQVAIGLENARLLEETRKRAQVEAQINSIGQRIQETTSVEEAMQIAIRELGRVTGAKETSVYLADNKATTS